MAAGSLLDADVREYLEYAPPEVIRCRRWNHGWDPTHDGFLVHDRGRREESWCTELVCMRCGSTAVDRFVPWTLERIGVREYGYVEGYLAPEGVQVSKQDVRVFLAEQQMSAPRSRRGPGRGRVASVPAA